ncbi:hypothetical protein ACQEU3_45050 [Spirillospora sp. CA-253888]
MESPIDSFTGLGIVGISGCGCRLRRRRWRRSSAGGGRRCPARKYAVACRDYVMAKVAYLSGVNALQEADRFQKAAQALVRSRELLEE